MGPTQWEPGAEFSIGSRPPEFDSLSEVGGAHSGSQQDSIMVESSPVDGEVVQAGHEAVVTFVDIITNDSDAEDHHNRVPERQSRLIRTQIYACGFP